MSYKFTFLGGIRPDWRLASQAEVFSSRHRIAGGLRTFLGAGWKPTISWMPPGVANSLRPSVVVKMVSVA